MSKKMPTQLDPNMLRAMARPNEEQASFRELSASELYCPKCKCAMPVREDLLLVLPQGNLHDYRCTRCGTSLGTREG